MHHPTASLRRLLASALFVGVVFGPAAWGQEGIQTQRVQFAKGADSAVVNGTIKGYQTVDYVLHAAAGQSMNVSLATKNTATYFNILAPGETEVAFFNGSVNGNQYEGTLAGTGDYRIRVYMMRSAARRNEAANYRLEMIVSGAPQKTSHDVLVPGTDYNATAKIPCVAEPAKPMAQCNAGVKRAPGGGTVHVTTPDGGSRVITFHDGKVSATDSTEPFHVERRDDWTIVKLGTSEVYEIPDALVFGG